MYNTTNTTNESFSDQFTCNVPYNETADTSLCLILQIHCTHNCPLFYPTKPNIYFISITIPLPTHILSIFYTQNIIWNACYSCIISKANSNAWCLNIHFQFNSIIPSIFQHHIHWCMQKEFLPHFYI